MNSKSEKNKKNINKVKKHLFIKKIKDFFNKLWKVLYKSGFTFDLHGGYESSGYLSFTIIFAIFPFMIFFTILIGYFGQTEIGVRLLDFLETTLPNDIKKTLLPVIDNVINGSKIGILSIATFALIWTSSSLIQGLKVILDKAYRIKIKSSSAINSYLSGRFISILKFLCITIFLILIIFFTIIFPKILALINNFIPIEYNFKSIPSIIKSFLLNIFVFLFIISINCIIPSKKQKIKTVFWGSVLTFLGWFLSLKGLTFYLTKMSEFQVVYGSLAGIIITLFFFQIMSIILIFGAEFNYNFKEIFYTKNKKQKIKK